MLLALFLTTASLAAGCTIDDVLAPPACSGDESAISVAQSVPATEFIPCLDDPEASPTPSIELPHRLDFIPLQLMVVNDDVRKTFIEELL